jgi:hypothetical protein
MLFAEQNNPFELSLSRPRQIGKPFDKLRACPGLDPRANGASTNRIRSCRRHEFRFRTLRAALIDLA